MRESLKKFIKVTHLMSIEGSKLPDALNKAKLSRATYYRIKKLTSGGARGA